MIVEALSTGLCFVLEWAFGEFFEWLLELLFTPKGKRPPQPCESHFLTYPYGVKPQPGGYLKTMIMV